jgi:hypothetical protein
MKTFFAKHNILFFLFIITFSIPSNAVIDYKPDAEKKTTIIKKQKKATKKGLFKRWKEKWILKKIKKLQKKENDKTMAKKANSSLLIGIGSLVLFIIALISGLNVFLLVITGLLAILGDIFSISVLNKTKYEKGKYRKERRTAKVGLTFSLLTGLIPLLALLILLIAVG